MRVLVCGDGVPPAARQIQRVARPHDQFGDRIVGRWLGVGDIPVQRHVAGGPEQAPPLGALYLHHNDVVVVPVGAESFRGRPRGVQVDLYGRPQPAFQFGGEVTDRFVQVVDLVDDEGGALGEPLVQLGRRYARACTWLSWPARRQSPLVVDLAEAAVEHYALNYSKHPPHVLFEQVRDVRKLLTPALKSGPATEDVRRQVGWLFALLGNLAYHLDNVSGARVHLDTAAAHGARTGDRRLEAWAWGAQSMVARASGRVAAAVEHAERGAAAASPGRVRAQLHAWALLPAFAAAGRGDDADHALARAMNELDTADEPEAPGRFGFDAAELALHQAEAYLALGRADDARACAESSLAACPSGTPGWAAASLVLAGAETSGTARDAAQRAHDVLDRVPAARLRSTARPPRSLA